ncbi:MAG: hypothetical protein LBE89_06365 [Helicobacteraceae bacterium]|jgi:hypothetical protein|nr:hypothetical protein [Helicobacteraceae bacterium]
MSLDLNSETLKNWAEYDYNPFFIFSQNGNVLYLNRSAELISGYEPVRTFYNLAVSYASIDFGFKTSFMPLNFGQFHFFAITVGYQDEESIGVRLYQSPANKEGIIEINKRYSQTNIYVLIDIAISLAKNKLNGTVFRKEFDPSIPDFRLSQNDLTKILRRAYGCFERSNTLITTVLKLKTGEFLVVAGKRYPILELDIKGQTRNKAGDKEIESFASSINTTVYFDADRVTLEIPIVD